MANFDYRNVNENLSNRFDGHLASNLWAQLVNEPTPQNLYTLQMEGFQLREEFPVNCQRIFISHQQSDINYAERIAYLAYQQHCQYWLDAHDPLLHYANGLPIQPPQKSILIAGIIEIALINCTQVLAVMSPNSAGSKWIPYEYGRIAHIGIDDASAWQHPNLIDPPEYMCLRPIHHCRVDIDNWLGNQPNNCGTTWNRPIPARLPNE
ncbi:MAG TPA: toll/interleukin-1 receptor domain-containing protein [Cyclobacteriaceae bacterium]